MLCTARGPQSIINYSPQEAKVPYIKHGLSGTPEYRAWKNIIYRCTNPEHVHYRHYGGRGITVCEEWLKNPASFIDYMGPRPSLHHSVGRIKNDRGYEPGNVRWETPAQQGINMRSKHVGDTAGVGKYPSMGTWSATSPRHPKTKKFIWIGRKFQTEEEAARARKSWIACNWPDYPIGEPLTEW